jgi:hypothetical protein
VVEHAPGVEDVHPREALEKVVVEDRAVDHLPVVRAPDRVAEALGGLHRLRIDIDARDLPRAGTVRAE